MIQALITCCEPVDIPDLNLSLKRGETIWIDDLTARQSKDLGRAQAMGKVRVNRKDRRISKPPRVLPASHTRPRPKPRTYEAPEPRVIEKTVVEEKIVEKVVQAEVDTEALAAQIRSQMMGDVREAIAQEVGKVLAQKAAETPAAPSEPAPSGMDADQMASVMEAVLKRVLPTHGSVPMVSGQSAPRAQEDEAPLYMPSNIVDKEAKAAISVQSKTSKGGEDLDDATAALRAMRKKKKQRGTDETEES